MRHRSAIGLAVAAAGALLVPMVAATPASSAVARAPRTAGDGWCASPTSAPCIVSVTRDSTTISDGDPTWDVTVGDTSGFGAHSAQVFVSDSSAVVNDPPYGEFASLAPGETGHTWSITVRVAFQPREADGYADNMAIDRVNNGDGTYDVTFTGNPVEMGVNAECTTSSWPWSCPSTSGANVTTFQGEVSDFEQWNDSSQWGDFNGMDMSTNVEASGIPPDITGDPFTITVDLANSHELAGAGSPFQGFFHITIPNQFLIDMGIDDPSTLDPAGISTSIGSGTVVVTPGPDSTQVDATGITFSPRSLKLKRGIVTPTRVTLVHVSRTKFRVHLGFLKARPRGSRIKGYEARCLATHHPRRIATGKHSPLVVKQLAAGVRYTCAVRARAKAGYGRWSKPRHIKG